ncbi:MAG: DUF1592 domain-containing protein [Acidobacteria bacterium]|nr:DUF1592 domain-containing protein [Acidobacteriota bacterium]
MFKQALIITGILVGSSAYIQAQDSGNPASQPAAPNRTVLDRYCVTCHNEKLKTAGLMLDKADIENVPASGEIWEKVIRKLRAGAMPPAGMPRPDKATYDSLAMYLETELDRVAEAKPNPGSPAAVHRLNGVEYQNAIHDLLAVDIDAGLLLPADESNYGFDNIGEVLSISPLRLERYLSAARKITRLAIGEPKVSPIVETYNLHKFLLQEDRMSEDLPFGSRGGIAVRHYFPLDGEYVIKIVLQRDDRDRVKGLVEPHQLDVRLDGARVKLFTIGGEHKGKSAPIFSTAGGGDPEQELYELTADEVLEVRFQAKTGMRLVGVSFIQENWVPEGALQYVNGKPDSLPVHHPTFTLTDLASYKGGDPAVDSVSIGGPYSPKGLGDTPSRRKIFVCRPINEAEEETCAKKIVSGLARRAYRRPVADADMQTLLSLYKAGRNNGGFEAGVGMALERILAGPEFLFRVERTPANVAPGAAYRISDLELASRLSFFLWSSIPDDELLDLAEANKLRDGEVLRQQVRRMLVDSRTKSLASNFAGQWLYVRNLRSMKPDQSIFYDFDENLRQAFQLETELFFESIVREDRSVLDLLAADYTFVNERLARYYGIPNVYGSEFRRVKLSDQERRGLLGQGSILTVTSYPNRTSPVSRGKWVLENILGTPPPPPPPNVPSLKEDSENGKVLSMRERMEEHRKNPACAVCHKLMDPLGFALENFDGTGKWRTTIGETKIDASGVLPDGTKFEGPDGLRKALMGKPEGFVTTVTEKLLTYSLGRGIEYYDQPAIRKILREAVSSDYRFSLLVMGVVNSTPFQMRRSEP